LRNWIWGEGMLDSTQHMLANSSSGSSPLRRDVRYLATVLGEVLVHQGGKELLDIVEKIREMSKSLRANSDETQFDEFKETIRSLNPEIRHQVIRAFAIYFQLVNIAEQNHRIRRKRDYERSAGESIQPGSIESAVLDLKYRNTPAEEVREMLQGISLELVMTAHPTEAMRRAILDIHKRIAYDVMGLDNPMLTHRERLLLREKLLNEVMTLWQTDELRERKPTVLDEVRNGMFYFDETLFEVLPDVYAELERCLDKYYPNERWHVPSYLKFGSWIGGDRDGNPSVTAEITAETLQMQRNLTLKKYEEAIRHMFKVFSFSKNIVDVSDDLYESIQEDRKHVELPADWIWHNEKEPYRIKLSYMLKKIKNIGSLPSGYFPEKYNTPEEFIADLRLIERCLRHQFADYAADTYLKKLIRQVEIFGFHLVQLDIRQHSKEHESAIAEILSLAGIEGSYSSLSEDEKIQLLNKLLHNRRPLTSPYIAYTDGTKECLNVYRTVYQLQQEYGRDCINSYLISMTQGASDMLEVMLLGKEAGLVNVGADGQVNCTIQAVPLFETIDDLHAAPDIMRTLFRLPIYRASLASHNQVHEIMLGYSDSNKDGGMLTANWELRTALYNITAATDEFGVKPKFFHGRGGALGRGGMPLNRSILAQPPHTVGAGIKITEQGEVMSSRYSMRAIAYRSLEQATSALLTSAISARHPQSDVYEHKWENAFDGISRQAQTTYQDLVFRDPDFLTFFKESTPLPEIGELNIGSRPSKRKNSDSFGDLRAIPWVFAWTQSRYLFPAWYAAGSGLQSFYQNNEERLAELRQMYQNWSFFQTMIDSLQMALSKADLHIAREYAGMIKDRVVAERIYGRIREEYELTADLMLKITGQQEILDNSPVIQESIRLRNPYVDPLSYLQVQLLAELRARREHNEDDSTLLREVLLTINGIAAGLRNTG